MVLPLDMIQCEIPANGQAECLNGLDALPVLPLVPDLDQRLLHDVLCIRTVERNAQCQPVKLILQRQHIITKTDLFHLLSILNDDFRG